MELVVLSIEFDLVLGVQRRVVIVAEGAPRALFMGDMVVGVGVVVIVVIVAIIVVTRPVIRFFLMRLERHLARENGVARRATARRTKNWQMAL